MSYKPVIYTFAVIGLLASIGLGATAVKGIQQMSKMPLEMSPYGSLGSGMMLNSNNATDTDMDFNSIFSTSSDPYLNMNDESTSGTDDAYLGTSVMYSSLRDPAVQMELKLPDTIQSALRTVIVRKDTKLSEIYRSDRYSALRMSALNDEWQTIIIQDLKTGDVYDTNINAHGNYQIVGSNIVYLSAEGGNPLELDQAFTYEIDTNETYQEDKLADGETFTASVVDGVTPVSTMKLGTNDVAVTVYAKSEATGAGKTRKAVRSVSYPPAS